MQRTSAFWASSVNLLVLVIGLWFKFEEKCLVGCIFGYQCTSVTHLYQCRENLDHIMPMVVVYIKF